MYILLWSLFGAFAGYVASLIVNKKSSNVLDIKYPRRDYLFGAWDVAFGFIQFR